VSGSLSRHRRFIAVLCGGFLGTITRSLLSMLVQGYVGKAWPYDILLINVTGAFVLSFVTALADATFLIGPTRRLFINVGFLGAYTTFSSLALGDVLLFAGGKWLLAVLYLVCSLVGGVLAVVLGDWLGQTVVTWARKPHAKVQGAQMDSISAPYTMSEDHVDVSNDVIKR
jgi:CrcB protein